MNVRSYRQGDPTYTTERQTHSRITSQITDITCTHFLQKYTDGYDCAETTGI